MSVANRIGRVARGDYGINSTFLRERGVFALLGAVLLAYLLYPFVSFFTWTDGLELAAFTDPNVLSAVKYSVLTAPVSTLVATVFGVPLAYVLARTSFPGKLLVDALIVLPLVMPPVVGGVMLLSGFGQLSPLGGLADALGIGLTDSYLGIVLAQTFVASPFVIITSRSGFEGIDSEIEQAARSLGKGPIETFRRVSLPLARGSILAGVVLTFARAMGEFGATMMTAYHPHTMPTQIWVTFVSHGVGATAPLVIILLGIGGTVVLALQFVGQRITLSS
ncbi:ABC transporter permease [Halanaeroarchaeum sulfurireducens]|uniref:ABC transporter permease n=1 Tax=Halanaeroarchaeum sulfurireducens TaxID=1604004 RepID=A0A0F7PBR1_9EURY|nr:ABC transporter permease [Halanaeroarchaeum sulfurireducens]AKH96778.1 ABC transporter permease [Halanaeroarchaeum sulfurireducens]ALG81180.1 ABC transporter permease [Halanaeroarchaeum sulfurireducens]